MAVPSAPVAAYSANVDDSVITLSWTRGGGSESGYHVRQTDPDNGDVFTRSSGATGRMVFSRLTPGREYSFSVAAFNSDGESSADVVTFTVPNPAAPGVVDDLDAEAGSCVVTLTWTPGTGTVRHWYIYRDNVLVRRIAYDSEADPQTYDDSRATPCVLHVYQVIASNKKGRSLFSNYVEAQTTDVLPTPILSADATSCCTVVLSWTIGTIPCDTRRVRTWEVYRDEVKIRTLNGSILTYTDDDLSACEDHTYYVKGVLEDCDVDSNEVDITTDDPPAPVLTGVSNAATTVSLHWTYTKPDGLSITGFEIYRDDVLVATVDDDIRSYTDTGRVACTEYDYKVSVIGSGDSSEEPCDTFSNEITVQTISGTEEDCPSEEP